MNFSPPFSYGGRGKSNAAEIRLSFAGERFHLEHEVIALIEVAFITLTYYMSKNETRPGPCTYTAPEKIPNAGLEMGGSEALYSQHHNRRH